MPRFILTCLLLSLTLAANASNFPRPSSLEPAVRFWTKVYTNIDTNQGYVHDDTNLSIVYETLDLPWHASHQVRQRMSNAAEKKYAYALAALAGGKRSGLNTAESRALKAWPAGTSNATFREASNRVRFQLGQADRFKEGLIRSGRWKPHIRRVLAMHQLPEELEVLPHVESSFNPSVYSKVAAAGMWQFMPQTAQQYMRVDHIIDERMDPYLSTEGAAKLLKRNYQVAESWPLALTAYNFGLGGIIRASKSMGTRDIGVLVARYQGPAFGFASRNFYACFLAALEVDRNAERYFGPVKLDNPINYDTVVLHHYVPAKALADKLQVPISDLKDYNPALMEPVWSGEKYIPRGFEIRLPQGRSGQSLETAVAALGSSGSYGFQKPDVMHKIRPGESLGGIARRYNTTVPKLMALNGMRNHNIRAGRTLRLPGNNTTTGAMETASTAPHPVSSSTPSSSPSPSESESASSSSHYVVQSGDSLWSIARRFNLSQKELVAMNGISSRTTLRPGQTLKVSGSGSGSGGGGAKQYVIQPGDSLWSIARRFNVSTSNLLAWNNLKKGHVIKPGQVLRLASN